MAEGQYQYVYWTERSISDSLAIKDYLQKDFSQKEIRQFLQVT
jgi:hypothetical protein